MSVPDGDVEMAVTRAELLRARGYDPAIIAGSNGNRHTVEPVKDRPVSASLRACQGCGTELEGRASKVWCSERMPSSGPDHDSNLAAIRPASGDVPAGAAPEGAAFVSALLAGAGWKSTDRDPGRDRGHGYPPVVIFRPCPPTKSRRPVNQIDRPVTGGHPAP
jgi:hypothetical protein